MSHRSAHFKDTQGGGSLEGHSGNSAWIQREMERAKNLGRDYGEGADKASKAMRRRVLDHYGEVTESPTLIAEELEQEEVKNWISTGELRTE